LREREIALGIRSATPIKKRSKHREREYEEDDAGSMKDFIVNDSDGGSYSPLEGYGSDSAIDFKSKKYVFKDYSSEESNMEADFDEI